MDRRWEIIFWSSGMTIIGTFGIYFLHFEIKSADYAPMRVVDWLVRNIRHAI